MKKNYISLFIFAFTAFTTSNAYRWTMSNFTSKNLLVQVELLASKNAYWVLIPAEQSADFDWSIGNAMAGFCLEKIRWVEAGPEILKKPWIDPVTMTVTGFNKDSLGGILDNFANKMPQWASWSKEKAESYRRKEVVLRFLPDEIYNDTVAQAKKLSGTKLGEKIVGWFADLIAQSKCRSRDISIIEEEDGTISFYTLAN